jgi:hypothetical protein
MRKSRELAIVLPAYLSFQALMVARSIIPR